MRWRECSSAADLRFLIRHFFIRLPDSKEAGPWLHLVTPSAAKPSLSDGNCRDVDRSSGERSDSPHIFRFYFTGDQVFQSTEMIVAGVFAAVLLVLLMLTFIAFRSARAKSLRYEREIDERSAAFEEAIRRADRQTVLLDGRASQEARLQDEIRALRQMHDDVSKARSKAEAEVARLNEAVLRLEHAAEKTTGEMTDLTQRYRDLQDKHGVLQSDHAALQADTDGKLASSQREVATLKELREEMARKFEELANATLRRTNSEFSAAHTEKLTELLTPFREHVGRFEEELRKVHGDANLERARLGQQIMMLTTQSESIRSEAHNLTRALKGDKQRQGAWGEMILERILEDSGLTRDLHYDVQATHRDDDGVRWRPDVVVKMPRSKCLVIDSKVSLVSYEAAVNAETDEERQKHLRDHVAAVRRHIDLLADKGYHSLVDGSVDYVLMFMPIEGALSEAWRQQGDLASYALAKGIGIMTPTTLMVTLRTVEHIWMVERRESNAEAIADRAGKLYDKVVGFVDNMQKVGTHLDRAASAHQDAIQQLSTGRGNVLGQIDKLKSMGARTGKEIPMEFEPANDVEGITDDAPVVTIPLQPAE